MEAHIVEAVLLVAKQFSLPERLVGGIVITESGGNPWAFRYEPGFYTRYIAPMLTHKSVQTFGAVSVETEAMGRATSWGLMQVMGQVARERGFKGTFFTQLCDPTEGLRMGCKHLSSLMGKYLAEDDAIAAYNAGSPRRVEGVLVNQSYVDKVRKNMMKF